MGADDLPPLDPERYYPLSLACRYVPSGRSGQTHVSRQTLWRWLREGVCQGVRRLLPNHRHPTWLVRGSELLRLVQQTGPLEYRGPTPAQRERLDRATEKRLRAMGFKYLG